MSGKFFLDTNIFIYAMDETAPAKAAIALELIRAGINGGGAVSYQVVQEFCHVVTRKLPGPLRQQDLEDYLAQVFPPLLEVQSSLWLFWQGLRWHRQHRLSWYDALIVAAALEAKCGVLYTEDLQHGQRFDGLLVQNPFLPSQ